MAHLNRTYPFLSQPWANRLINAYGTDAQVLLGDAARREALGIEFGAPLTETELRWLRDHEFAQGGEDVLWWRSELGLRMTADQMSIVDTWITNNVTARPRHQIDQIGGPGQDVSRASPHQAPLRAATTAQRTWHQFVDPAALVNKGLEPDLRQRITPGRRQKARSAGQTRLLLTRLLLVQHLTASAYDWARCYQRSPAQSLVGRMA